jgi:hypothetical protein
MCSGVLVRHDTAFMGFYAVDPKYQGIGVGRELWAKTVARLDSSIYNIGLYGVPSMSEKYKRSGFKIEDSTRMLIFESEPGKRLSIDQLKRTDDLVVVNNDNSNDRSKIELLDNGQLSESGLIGKLVEYDEKVHGHSRDRLLRNYLFEADEVPLALALVSSNTVETPAKRGQTKDEPERKHSCCSNEPDHRAANEETLSSSVKSSLSISDMSAQNMAGAHQELVPQRQQGAQILGYGCIRHDNTGGAMVGPLYAKSDDYCEVILRELIDRFAMPPGGKYSLMSLTSNPQADKLLRRIGLVEMDQCSRMFTQFIPEASLDQIYYVHSPNFTLF